jgi:hypothetical protein
MEFYNVCMNWDRLIGSPLSLFSSLFRIHTLSSRLTPRIVFHDWGQLKGHVTVPDT